MSAWFLYFALSGFCCLLYETLWLRLSMAQFGVTSPSLSIVVSVFMAGLALGSWLVSRLAPRLANLDPRRALLLYAAAELGIGLFSLPVPWEMRTGGAILTKALNGQGPFAWYAAALGWQTLTLLPCCALMGATIPLGMNAIARAGMKGGRTSFSWLYLANVLGAVVGALLSSFVIIEILGFTRTLLVAAILNLLIAALAFFRSRRVQPAGERMPETAATLSATPGPGQSGIQLLLFSTGFCTLGMEVVWTRQLTPYLGTVVYAFASILAVYLLATFAGAAAYRRFGSRAPSPLDPAIWGGLAVLGALSLLAADAGHFGGTLALDGTGWHLSKEMIVRPFVAIAPFSAALGFITPQLVDRYSAGDARRAGAAYAVNTVGCILGPLVAGFVLLPNLSESISLLFFLLPFVAAALFFFARGRIALLAVEAALLCALAIFPKSFEQFYPKAQVLRDHTATAIATGRGPNKQLLVNGVGMTVLTPATKMMAHLPAAMLGHPPRNALVICFGMGTSFRSLMSWGIPVTAVELVPSVPKLFGYFHRDAAQVLASPNARIVIDDGRRFLQTTNEQYDVIVIDPPPPVSAASSSLLYSTQFYDLIKRRLAPGGILQQWIPGGDRQTLVAFMRALDISFPHILILRGFVQGFHILASESPLPLPAAAALAGRLPTKAAADLIEWGPRATAEAQFADTLHVVVNMENAFAQFPSVAALDDDLPLNEYYLVRSLGGH